MFYCFIYLSIYCFSLLLSCFVIPWYSVFWFSVCFLFLAASPAPVCGRPPLSPAVAINLNYINCLACGRPLSYRLNGKTERLNEQPAAAEQHDRMQACITQKCMQACAGVCCNNTATQFFSCTPARANSRHPPTHPPTHPTQPRQESPALRRR